MLTFIITFTVVLAIISMCVGFIALGAMAAEFVWVMSND